MSLIPDVLKQKWEDAKKLETMRTPAPGCSACEHKRLHTVADWAFHPDAGKGQSKEHGAKK